MAANQLPPGFVLDKPAKNRALPPGFTLEKPETNQLGAAVEGFGQGATMGYLPQLQAGLASLLPDPNSDVDEALKAQGFTLNQPEESYTSLRDENIRRQEKLAEANPWTYNLSQLAGTSAMAPLAEIGVARALPTLSKARQLGVAGAGVGFTQNPGDVEGEFSPIQLGDRTQNTITGGLLGFGGGKLAEKISALPKNLLKTSGKLETEAEKNALRQLGAQKPEMRRLSNQKRVKDVGRFAIDEKLAPLGGDADDIAQAAAKARNKYGQEIGATFDALENAAPGAGTFDRKKLAETMRASLSGDENVAGALDADKIMGKLDEYITAFEKKEGPATAKELLSLKGKFDARINYSKRAMDLPELQQGYQNLRHSINDTINQRAESLPDEALGTLGQRLKEANKKYSLASSADDIAQNRLAMEGNNFFSLSDRIAGAAGGVGGLMAGGFTAVPAAAASAIGMKALRTYGPGVGTKTLDAAARGTKRLAESPWTKRTATVGEAALGVQKDVPALALPVAIEAQRFLTNPWTLRREQ